MIHSIVSEFAFEENAPLKLEYVCKGDTVLELLRGEQNCTIHRILSTNPQDYLNPDLSPGSVYNETKMSGYDVYKR